MPSKSKRTRLSLYYLLAYLITAGFGFLLIPQVMFELLLSNGDYGDIFPRVAGMLILALTLLVFQIMRLKIESLYVTTVAVRLMILACLVWLYLQSRDPFFIIVIAIVSLGVMLTISGYYMDQQAG
jgi:hypothetical protein